MFHDPDFTPFTPRETPSYAAALSNYMENWPPSAYREGFWSLPGLWRLVPKTVYLTDPALIEEMLVTRAETFTRDVITRRSLGSVDNRTSLFFAEDADWKWQRRALSSAFRHENLLALVPTFAECADATAKAWRAATPGAPVEIMTAMSQTTFAVIERAVLGGTGALDHDKYLAALAPVLKATGWRRMIALFNLPAWTPFFGARRARAASARIFAEIDRIIEARRAEGETRRDLLGLLLSARDPESGRVMTDAELSGNLNGLLIAGHETSAVALGWSLWLLAKDQASQERLRREVVEVAGSDEIGPQTVEKLVFTRQVLQEAMRLFPPFGALGRQPKRDTTLGPHAVTKREPIFVAIWALHRHEKLWDDPNGFDPDRFSPERSKGRHRYAYLPFGAGPRICIGMTFAMLEMMTILATLAREFRFRTVPGHRLELDPSFATRARGGLPLLIEPAADSEALSIAAE